MNVTNVVTVDANAALVYVVEAAQQADNRGLAGAGGAYQCDGGAGPSVKTDVFQNPFRFWRLDWVRTTIRSWPAPITSAARARNRLRLHIIAEAHILKFHIAINLFKWRRTGPIGHGGLYVQGLENALGASQG